MPQKSKEARARYMRAWRARLASGERREPHVTKEPVSLDVPAAPRIPRIEPREGTEPGEIPREQWPELRRVIEYRLFSMQKYRRSATCNMNRSSLRLALAELPERPIPDDIWRWMVALTEAPPKGPGLQPSTVNRYKGHVGAAYEWCRKRGLYTANPCAGLPDLQVPEEVPEYAPGAFGGPAAAVEMYERLRAVAADDCERVLLIMLRFCGLTRQEIFGLDECDFDPRSWTLTIQRGQKAGLDRSATELKTRNRRRVFVLPDFLPDREMRELATYVRTPRTKGRPYGKRDPGEMASFEPTTRIFPWSSYRLERFMLKLRATAPEVFGPMRGNDLRNRPLHLFRHAFAETAADVLKASDPARMLLKLQKLLGHGSLSSTEKYLRKRRGLGLAAGDAEGMRDALASGRIPGQVAAPVVVVSNSGHSVDAGSTRRKGGKAGTVFSGFKRER